MKTCSQCGEPVSLLRSLLDGLCRKCRQGFEETDKQRAAAEATREWNLKQVSVVEERKWQPDECPFCGGAMLKGYIWVEGDSGSVVWAAREVPYTYTSHDIRLVPPVADEEEDKSRRAHLCENCGSLIVVQAFRPHA